jgi:hypothetical protein
VASNKINRPLSNKPIQIVNFEKTVGANSSITLEGTNYITGIWINTPVYAIAVKVDSQTLKVLTVEWNGSAQMNTLKELAQGTTVKGTAIFF